MHWKTTTFLTLILGLTLIPLAGCSEDETTLNDPGSGSDPTPGFTNPTATFRTVCEDMDLAVFMDLLHEDFRLYLQQDTVQRFDLPRNHFTRDDEQAIHGNIFGGTSPHDTIAGVTGITFTTFEPQTDWSTAPPDDPNFPNALFAPFNVKLEYERAGSWTIIVQGILKFYVTEVAEDRYVLLGIVDLTQSKSVDDTAWGELNALYWSGDD